MKSPTAYYLMLLYITVMIKPLIPIIQDEWEHQFNEIEHISIVHAKYGSHHLEKELAGTTDNDNNKNQNTLRSEDEVPFHTITPEYKYDVIINKSSVQYHTLNRNKLPLVYIFTQGQPPKFS